MDGGAGVGRRDDAEYVHYTVNSSLAPITLIYNLVCQAASIYFGKKIHVFFFFFCSCGLVLKPAREKGNLKAFFGVM